MIIMAKAPAPGKVKTRLTGELSPVQAAAVHEVFLRHVVECVRRLHVSQSIVISFDPPEARGQMQAILGDELTLAPQSSGDLGARLAAAMNDVKVDQAVLFLGVDSPDLPAGHLRKAVDLLGSADVVIGPTDDGGYWCLGLSGRVKPAALLGSIDWSSGREQAQTLERARLLGYNVVLADPWCDVDWPDDLLRLVGRLKRSSDPDDCILLDRLRALPGGVVT